MQRNTITQGIIIMQMLVLAGCSGTPTLDKWPKVEATTEKSADYVYEYLRQNPSLYARDGDKNVHAPAAGGSKYNTF